MTIHSQSDYGYSTAGCQPAMTAAQHRYNDAMDRGDLAAAFSVACDQPLDFVWAGKYPCDWTRAQIVAHRGSAP